MEKDRRHRGFAQREKNLAAAYTDYAEWE